MTPHRTTLPALPDPPNKLVDWLAVLPVVALALLARLSTLDSASLWCDEIAQVHSYYFDNYKQVMYWAARFQQQPLDYWLGYVFFKFNQSDFVARLPAALCGTLTVLVVFHLARRMVGRGVALLIAVGLACSPHMIHYSQEARPYSSFWFTLLLSTLLLARAWQYNRWRDWLVFLPVVLCCLLTRSLGSLMMTAGMGVWALADVVRSIRSRRATAGESIGESFPRQLLRRRGTRLLLCLTIAWAPALHIMQFILHRSRKFGYLAQDAKETFDWQGNLAAFGQALESVFTAAMPIGIVLIPLGVVGIASCLMRRTVGGTAPYRVILIPAIIGYFVHAGTYALLVDDWVPKYVYWGYTLPFIYLGAGYVLQRGATWWRARSGSPGLLRGAWVVLAGALLLQLGVDHTRAIVHKPNWRAACKAIAERVDPNRDVVFGAEAQLYGTAGMVFRIPQHYWPTDEHLVNVLRDQEKLLNEGRPILNRTNCRVALMLRCDPDLDGQRLRTRLSKTNRLAFTFRDFHQFIVLISRPRFETADAGLIALARAVSEMFDEDYSVLNVHMQMGLAWALAKQGEFDHSAQIFTTARELVLPQYRADFDKVYKDLAQHIEDSQHPPARLISGSNRDK